MNQAFATVIDRQQKRRLQEGEDVGAGTPLGSGSGGSEQQPAAGSDPDHDADSDDALKPSEPKRLSVGDSVLLSTKNLRNAPGKARKFLPRYVGPFKVTGKLGEAAYRLELPPTMSRLHPVFHVSLLKKYTGSQGFHPPPVMEWLEDAPHYEVHSLLSHRQVRFKKRMEYLVKWTGYDDTYNTWEPEAMLAGAPQILASQMLKEAVRQFPAGRVVMVDEFRTSRVSSAYSHPNEALPGQPPESFRQPVCYACCPVWPPAWLQLLVQSWAAYPGPLLSERMVQPLQSYLTKELTATKKLTTSIMAVIRVLALIEEANQIGRQLPPEAFYNQLISDKMDVADHYTAWRHSQPVASHAPRPRAASPLRHNAPASRAEELRRARRHTTADSDAGSSALPPRSRGLSPGRQRHAAVHIAVNVGRDTATTSRATTARSEPSVRPFQTLVERAPQPHFDPTRPFSFCSFPFLLDARAKSNLLHIEARFQMEQTMAHARMEQQLYGAAARNALNMRLQGGRVMPKSQSARHDLPGSAGPSQLQPRHSAGSQGSAQESSEAEKRRSPGPHGLRGLMSALQQGTSRLLRGVTASGAAEDRGHARELPPPEPFSVLVALNVGDKARFYDRDVSAALNIRRCAVGPGPRPTELCYWDGRPAMPKPGRPGQEWVYLRDKALLRKWRR
ncbi:hypothetical protein QJQ45_013359 [Haematococcus lacustris]|nr:hypothetical protein QJQ45_013359 [Haematococcus lacustris]